MSWEQDDSGQGPGADDADHGVGQCAHDWPKYGGPMRCVHCNTQWRDVEWCSQSRGPITVGEMDTTHLTNTINFIRRGRARMPHARTLLPAMEHELMLRAKALEPGTKMPMTGPTKVRFGQNSTLPGEVMLRRVDGVALAGYVREKSVMVDVVPIDTETSTRCGHGITNVNTGTCAACGKTVAKPAGKPELFTPEGLLNEAAVAVRRSDGKWHYARSFIVASVNRRLAELDRKVKMLQAERGPGIKPAEEPVVVCDNGWDD